MREDGHSYLARMSGGINQVLGGEDTYLFKAIIVSFSDGLIQRYCIQQLQSEKAFDQSSVFSSLHTPTVTTVILNTGQILSEDK